MNNFTDLTLLPFSIKDLSREPIPLKLFNWQNIEEVRDFSENGKKAQVGSHHTCFSWVSER
jgi:hypothetical protein